MIIGLGCDLIGIARIASIYQRHGQRFLARVYSPAEIAYCLDHRDPAPALAARWAAKEATFKAFGTGCSGALRFPQVEVERDAQGAPHLRLHAAAAELATSRGATHLHCSLSHADGMAMATVILEARPAGAS